MCGNMLATYQQNIIKYTTVQKFGVSKFFLLRSLMLDKKYSNIVYCFSIVI